ncbi:MAG TPA: alpha/beta hydrolase [Chloroflexus aurantiacus]|jgi:pimeloyl-ACP methyl ester carboxylesterase/CRP-like cAMP-binding protein|uniref:Alpha/beta hydrolase fold-containing protein n=1 Tax=Chloroflexus aurantiacus (strain ATCC 29366 / DSM 635 / J-10-fl) TaxID=324602 RepID=A9WG11_CHLAA|nr:MULTISPECIES: alpha/beta fold hydrolase [Chloroflexus]ABY36165.1 alpha/beta hydrolase fold-containing protein [Chloroflexus aurantiacus J-10-fl]RMG51142.1 MAG: alpha/beta fold hydrolase [Chloroflexota bacterium]HBW69396.1 alpha/beta hydrolase [Chloroflexus aurantiacus]
MEIFSIDGAKIHAIDTGPRNAQLAILIHGWSSSSFAMSPLIPLLSRRFRCIAVDLPGYGESPPLRERATIGRYAQIIGRLITGLSEHPAVLVGHSMGGMISATLALQIPQLVDRMVLLCPTISGRLSFWINTFVSPITMLERFPLFSRLLALLEPSMLYVTDSLMKPASFAERSAISEADYLRLRADARRPGQGRVRAECFVAMRNQDLSGRLRELETPALVIWGAEDNTVPLRDAGVIADEWRSADLRIVPKAGHWPHFETPDVTLRYIASYLGLPSIVGEPDILVQPAEVTTQITEFLANSQIGSGLSLAQRTRLAAHLERRRYPPGTLVDRTNQESTDLYLVQEGSLEVWSPPLEGDPDSQRLLMTVVAGQITGEMSLLDGGRRSADLRAGEDGVTILALRRERLRALAEDDPALGNAVLWNIATALALRLRLANWQQQGLVRQLQALRQ